MGVALELLVRVAEQRHAVAAVEDLRLHAIEGHVLQALRRVPGAGAAGGVSALHELVALQWRHARGTKASRVEGPQRLADQEVALAPIDLVDKAWCAVAVASLHARRPEVWWLQNVGVRR